MNSLFILIVLSTLIFFFLGGYTLGKWRSTAEIRRLIKIQLSSYLLGQKIKNTKKKKDIAKAYYDSETAFKEMDQ